MRRLSIIGKASATAAMAGALLLNAGASYAAGPALDQCQKGIEAAAKVYHDAIRTALTGCADAVRTQQVKEAAKAGTGPLAVAAKTCEAKLKPVYDLANVTPGKSAADKFKAALAKLVGIPSGTPKCDVKTLIKLGHLISGTGGSAPPNTGTDATVFVADSLLTSLENSAISEVVAEYGDAMGLIAAAVGAPESKAGANDATCCTNTVGCNDTKGYRPNLCGFGLECNTHACQLDGTSGGQLVSSGILGTIPLTISGRSTLGICSLTKGGQGFGAQSGFEYIIGGAARTLDPVNLGGGLIVCVNVNRSEGWCDCTGHGIALNTNFCQDRVVSGGVTDDCPGGVAADATDDNQGFTGTKVGAVAIGTSGASAAGDCVNFFTTQFIIHQSPATYGPDTTPCTSDDTQAPQAPASVPLTTGTAVASVIDAVSALGTCTLDGATSCIEDVNCNACNVAKTCGDPLHTACTKDSNCTSVVGSDGFCKTRCTLDGSTACTTSAQCGTCAGPLFTTLTVGPFTGSKTSCKNYEASTLSGLQLVGAFPAAAGSAPIGDSCTGFHLKCQ